MKNIRSWWIRARCSVQAWAGEITRIKLWRGRLFRKPTRMARPWWQYDIRELIVELNRRSWKVESVANLAKISGVSQWTLRFRLFILSGIYGVSLMLAILVVFPATLGDVQREAHERKILEARYLKYADQVDLLPVYQTQSSMILERFGTLLDSIPASLEAVHVLSQINKAAKESGLYLELFKPLAEEVHPYYVVLPVDIRLRGDYNAIAKFLEFVSGMKHLVTVDVVILPSATHENQIVLASLLKAYRYKELPRKAETKAQYATP